MNDKVIYVYDFGGQSAHLILRRIHALGFSAEIVPPHKKLASNVAGIILSGGARSVYEKNAPLVDMDVLRSDLPILGICYGHQLIAHLFGGRIRKGDSGEFEQTMVSILKKTPLFKSFGSQANVWMNHRDSVFDLPKGFEVTQGARIRQSRRIRIQKRKFSQCSSIPKLVTQSEALIS